MDEQAHRPDSCGFTYTCPQCGCESFYKERPLFIPLKREFFEQFTRREARQRNTVRYGLAGMGKPADPDER